MRRRRVPPALLAALALAGCGGGVSIGVGIGVGGFDDDPPEVSLAVTPTSAAPGGALELVAAATDDYGVDRVRFFRVDGATAVLLGTDSSAPYRLETMVPGGASGSLQFYARAIDEAGQGRDSALVTVTVLP